MKPIIVKNPKIAAHMQAMFEKHPIVDREHLKTKPSEFSISTVKLNMRCTRHVARLMIKDAALKTLLEKEQSAT